MGIYTGIGSASGVELVMGRRAIAGFAADVGSFRSFHLMLFSLIALTLTTGSCRQIPVGKASATTKSNPVEDIQLQTSSLAAATLDAEPGFKLRYKTRKDSRGRAKMRTGAGNEHTIGRIVEELNNQFSLPNDIYICFKDCHSPDAYYDDETCQVVLCYQLIDDYQDLFSRKVRNKSKLNEAVKGAMAATFLHELGHALVDVLHLPTTGKEEDAVDQLSTLILVNRIEDGEEMALAAARAFKLYADLEKGEEKLYWDEHSLDEQRFYDTICMVYGYNPDKYEYLVMNGTLPWVRADTCPEYYDKIRSSWKKLLGPYLKNRDGDL
jgi:Putative metallopeptidase